MPQLSADQADVPGPEAGTALRAQRSFLAVNEIDRILLTSSGGKLHPFLPLDPFHGVHRAYAWEGVGPPHYVQINASASRHADGRYNWTWPARQVHAHDGLTMLAVALEPSTGRIEDVLWRYAATAFKRLAYLSHGPAGDAEYWIEASPTGHDRFASHRLAVSDLWERLAPPARVRSEFEMARRESTRDEGTVYEQLVAADLIRQSRGGFALYRPGMDIAGRDLLVQMVDSWRTIFLQIKGTTQIVRGTRIQCLVKRWTFRPSEDFWLAFYFFDVEAGAFAKHCWLVPSLEFAARTADQHFSKDLTFQVTMTGEGNKWREFRHDIGDQAAVLRRALLSPGRSSSESRPTRRLLDHSAGRTN